MKRRKFIASLFIVGGGIAASYYGVKIIESYSDPDINYLEANKDLIADLAETIIPKTITPGAKEAKVEEFIIHMIKSVDDVKIENNFINGLHDLSSYSNDEYGLPYSKLNRQQQNSVMLYFKNEGSNFDGKLGKIKNKLLGKSFFSILKEYTCIGYCTSMSGVTKGLAYEAIPSRYLAITNYTPGQKSWATK